MRNALIPKTLQLASIDATSHGSEGAILPYAHQTFEQPLSARHDEGHEVYPFAFPDVLFIFS